VGLRPALDLGTLGLAGTRAGFSLGDLVEVRLRRGLGVGYALRGDMRRLGLPNRELTSPFLECALLLVELGAPAVERRVDGGVRPRSRGHRLGFGWGRWRGRGGRLLLNRCWNPPFA
jgi:hypothetical protein